MTNAVRAQNAQRTTLAAFASSTSHLRARELVNPFVNDQPHEFADRHPSAAEKPGNLMSVHVSTPFSCRPTIRFLSNILLYLTSEFRTYPAL